MNLNFPTSSTPFPIPENPVYDISIRKLLGDDPAHAANVFNPLFQVIINNIHAIKLSTDALTGLEISGVSAAFSSLPSAAGLSNGVFYLVQMDETRLNSEGVPKATIYKAVDGAWVYVRDYSLAGILSEKSVCSEEGVLGIRYWGSRLQVFDGDSWIYANGSTPIEDNTQATLGASFLGAAYLDGSLISSAEPIAAFLRTESGELISGAVRLETGEIAQLVLLPVDDG